MKDSRVCVVLSGGGAKAAAQVGAVGALLERGVVPQHYVGTSMGSVVGACFASGLAYADITRRVTSVTRRDVARASWNLVLGLFAKSLFRAGPLRRTIGTLVPATRFDELKTPLTVTAVDEERGDLVLFGEGGSDVPLVDALYASCALPGYYPPQAIGHRRYVDGGMRSVLALDVAARFEYDLIYAVQTGPALDEEPPQSPVRLPAFVRTMGNALRIMMAAQADAEVARSRNGSTPVLMVQPALEREATFAVKATDRFLAEGHAAGHRALEQWSASV